MVANSTESDSKITICLGADRKFAFPLAVTLTSLSRAHAPDRCRIFVMAEGFDNQSRALVEQAAGGGLEIRWLDVREFDLGRVRLPWPDVVTKAACFRLLIPDLLPATIERVIYLDCDTVVCKPLDQLWTTPLHENELAAAVYDAYVPWAGAPGGTAWRELNLSPSTPYFNSGVMVIPVQRWRERELGAKAIRLMEQHELIYMDQCALNSLIRGAWHPVAPTWNLQTPFVTGWHFGWVLYGEAIMREGLESPAVIHYSSGDTKPWRTPRHPMAEKWYDTLDQTAWKGWRPAKSEAQAPVDLPEI